MSGFASKKGQVPLVALAGLVVLLIALAGMSGNHSSSTASSFATPEEENNNVIPDWGSREVTATKVADVPNTNNYAKEGLFTYYSSEINWVKTYGLIPLDTQTIKDERAIIKIDSIEGNKIYGEIVSVPNTVFLDIGLKYENKIVSPQQAKKIDDPFVTKLQTGDKFIAETLTPPGAKNMSPQAIAIGMTYYTI